MDKIMFGTYIFPLGPEIFQLKYVREPHYVTSNGNVLFAGMSALKKTITGKGYFTGENAYQDIQTLANMCDGTPRVLSHSRFGEFNAYLTCVEVLQEPRENHIAYSFEFREANADDVIPK